MKVKPQNSPRKIRSLRTLLTKTVFFHVYAFHKNFAFRKRAFFGQFGEDNFLEKLLPEINGTYVDIGAGWPVIGSNSYKFYKKGWSGILVDPITANFQLLKLFRRRDDVLQALVGNTIGEIDFYEIHPYVFSTTKEEYALKAVAERNARLKRVTRLKVVALRDICPQLVPEQASFLSIDVEGGDLSVLESNNWSFTRPRVICVEEWDNEIQDGHSLVKTFLEDRGYVLFDRVGLSSFFVENEYFKKYSRCLMTENLEV